MSGRTTVPPNIFARDLNKPSVEFKATAMNLLSYTRFVYRAERREGTWRIVSFDAVYLRDELTPAVPGHSIVIDPNELKKQIQRMIASDHITGFVNGFLDSWLNLRDLGSQPCQR